MTAAPNIVAPALDRPAAGIVDQDRVRRFALGDTVRCHADCTLDHHDGNFCSDGTLVEDRGEGWWKMTHPVTRIFFEGTALVHEQELEHLSPNDKTVPPLGRDE